MRSGIDGARSILVMQWKFIGDAVLASVLIRNLRIAYPSAKIVFLCASGLEGFIERQGIADEALPVFLKRLRGSVFQKAFEIGRLAIAQRRRKFDLTIDLTDTKTSRILTGLINAPSRVGYDPPEKGLRRGERQPANILATTYGEGAHYLYRYLSPLQALKLPVVHTTPQLEPTPEADTTADALLAQAELSRKPFIAVHAGASSEGRRWPPERFAAVLEKVFEVSGLNALIVGGPDEVPIATRIKEVANSPVTSLTGQLPLDALLAVLKRAVIFFGNESGPMHVAAAVGTPVVGLFGLTDPRTWGPIGVPSCSLRPSMPCACLAPGVCKPMETGNVFCVRHLQIPEVQEAVMKMIASTDTPEGRAQASLL